MRKRVYKQRPGQFPIGMSAEAFNAKVPVGTAVLYQPIRGVDRVDATKTRSEAWPLGNGDVVVKVEGRAGGVAIDHLELAT